MTLNEININDTVYIKEINASKDIKRRMLDLGLVKGTKVRKEFTAPFGEPSAYVIRGTLLALRNDDAKKIEIESVKDNE